MHGRDRCLDVQILQHMKALQRLIYPRGDSQDPFENLHPEKIHIHSNTQHQGVCGPSLVPTEHLEFRTSDLA